jgi:hypothetical protein
MDDGNRLRRSDIDVVAFDVNETLFSLDAIRDARVRHDLSDDLVDHWFARTLRDGFALTTVGEHAPVPVIGAAALRSVGGCTGSSTNGPPTSPNRISTLPPSMRGRRRCWLNERLAGSGTPSETQTGPMPATVHSGCGCESDTRRSPAGRLPDGANCSRCQTLTPLRAARTADAACSPAALVTSAILLAAASVALTV